MALCALLPVLACHLFRCLFYSNRGCSSRTPSFFFFFILHAGVSVCTAGNVVKRALDATGTYPWSGTAER